MQRLRQRLLANILNRCAHLALSKKPRAQICSGRELSLLTQAHDPLDGAVAKHAGFKNRWPAGLSIARSVGDRGPSEAPSSRIVEPIKRIAGSLNLPLRLDGSSVWMFNAQLLRKPSQDGAAGLALERSRALIVGSSFREPPCSADIDEPSGWERSVIEAVRGRFGCFGILVARYWMNNRFRVIAVARRSSLIAQKGTRTSARVIFVPGEDSPPIVLAPAKCKRTRTP